MLVSRAPGPRPDQEGSSRSLVVGALMAGAPTLDAGRFQVVVLVCLITAQTVATTLLVRIVGPSPVLAV